MPFKSLTLQIVAAMLLGSLAGYFWGADLAFAGDLGKLIIQLIKVAALPLVFFAIIEALLSTNIDIKMTGRFFTIIGINSFFAAATGLLLSNYFRAGELLRAHFDSALGGAVDKSTLITKKYSITEILAGYLPESFVHPFFQNSVVGVVILALAIGCAARHLKNKGCIEEAIKTFESLVVVMLKIFEVLLLWIVKLVPIAVFGVVCKTVGQYGFSPFKGLSLYVAIAFAGFFVQVFFVYQAWIYFVCGRSLKEFWSNARAAIVYAFGTNSSLATLPLTLQTLDKLKVSKASSRLGACVGTNLNNDGILLYECMAVLFVAQAYGIHMPLEVQAFTLLLCVLAAIGVAGVPEAGIVSLSLVLTAVNLPLEILGMLLTVDWLVARGRSVVNVLSDMTVSIALDGRKT
jgi:Na+/H+-dicarboxylate symporter